MFWFTILILSLKEELLHAACLRDIDKPTLRQIDQESVLVSWVGIIPIDYEPSAYKLIFGPRNSIEKSIVSIDSTINFEIVNVEFDVPYAYEVKVLLRGK